MVTSVYPFQLQLGVHSLYTHTYTHSYTYVHSVHKGYVRDRAKALGNKEFESGMPCAGKGGKGLRARLWCGGCIIEDMSV